MHTALLMQESRLNHLKRIVAVVNIMTLALGHFALPVHAAVGASTSAQPTASQTKAPVKKVAGISNEINRLTLADDAYSNISAKPPIPVTVDVMEKEDYKADEPVTVTVNNPDRDAFTAKVVNAKGEEIPVEKRIVDRGSEAEVLLASTNQFVPGKFTIEVTDAKGNISKQDFTWGVLALNTDKATYKPQETAAISMAVLDDKGEMVCNADVTLKITNEQTYMQTTLSTENGKIEINKECSTKILTTVPDYEATYVVGDEGKYAMELQAKTEKGSYTIHDEFNVKAQTPFEIRRTSATRLYPPLTYPMNIEVTASEDFEGTVTETVPDSFTITPVDQQSSYDGLKTVYLDGKDPEKRIEQNVLGASMSALQMPFDGSYAITQGFGGYMTDGELRNFYSQYGLSGHDGVDFALPMGTPLYAVDDGNVVFSGPGDYGITIIIQHAWGKSYYGHLSKAEAPKESSVKKGSLIGYSGNTGESTGPHLHFGMKPENPDMNNGYSGKIDPLPYLNLTGNGIRPPALEQAINSSGVLSATTSAESEATHSADKPNLTEPVAPSASASATPEQTKALNEEKAAPFTVLSQEIANEVADSETSVTEKVKVLKWKVSLKKGEKTTLSYAYKAPEVSPQFYLLGSVKIFNKDEQLVFDDVRKWQLAGDAIGAKWYDYNWLYRKEISIDSSQVPSTQTNFPVLVSLTSDSNLSTSSQADGDDILFTDGTGITKLSHEIESYSSGTLVAWVEVPSVSSSSNTSIYMYYGNATVSSQQDVANTWNNGSNQFRFVQHLNDGNVSTVVDSTTNGNNGTKIVSASQPSNYASGKIGAAMDFAGNSAGATGITISGSPANILDVTDSDYTFSGWFNPDTIPAATGLRDYAVVGRRGNFSGLSYAANPDFFATLRTTSAFNANTASNVYATGSWHYVVQTVNNTSKVLSIYVNGSLVDSTSYTGTLRNYSSTEPYMIGRADPNGTCNTDYVWCADGKIDEARLSNVARSADWIATEYNNQNSPGTFYTVGSEETKVYAPLPAELMRHGKFFDTRGEQPFVF